MEKLIKNLKQFEEAFIKMAREKAGPDPDGVSYGAFLNAEICRKAAEELKRNIPQETELEGGGSSWWYVCPECHCTIDQQDHFCKHCGQAIKSGTLKGG